MNRIIKKLCLLIASSDLTENQLREVCEWIDMNGARALAIAVSKIRSAAGKAVSMDNLDDDNIELKYRSWNNHSFNKSDLTKTSFQVDRLLRNEAGLSALQASEKLVDLLQQSDKYNSISLPQLGKQSFRKWIDKLSNYVPYSEILHIAIIIRNKIIHEPESDWPLKDR